MSEQDIKVRLRRARRVAHAKGVLLGVLSMLRPGDIVLDCGANEGLVTARLAATGATVHAFEPDPYNIAKLRARFADTPNVTLHEAAVGASAGSVRLLRHAAWDNDPDHASVSSTVVPGGRGIAEGDGIDVPMIDLPAFLLDLAGTGEIAFLKLDIEGAELELLEEMERRALFDRVRLTLAETHELKFRALRPRFAALRQRIAAAYPLTRVNLDWI